MANIRAPEYGVKKDELTLTTQDPAAVLYGVTPDNKWVPVKVGDDGSLFIGSSITLDAGDLEIGAVEIKNYNTDDRAYVSPAHEVLAQARLYDGAGTAITSSLDGSKQGLDVHITGGAIVQSDTDDDTILSGQTLGTVITLGYGFNGADWKRLRVSSNGLLVDGSGVTQPISAVSLPLPTGAATEATLATRATEVTLSGFRTDFNAVDFATQTTLLAVKTDLDKFTFASGSVNSNITNATLAVTQSGVWSTGRTWTLASGTDSVSAVQSGTWNINNISGTISLPTGASTEATLAAVKAQTDKLTFTATRLLVDGSGVTQPVSGTVNVGNFPAVQTVAVSQSGTDNNIAAADSVIVSENVSTSSNVYATARPVNGDMVVRHFKTKKIFVKNTSAFNGRVQIFGSVDNGSNFDVTVVPDQAVNAGVTSITDLTDALTHIQIQVRSQNNGQTTTWTTKAYVLGV